MNPLWPLLVTNISNVYYPESAETKEASLDEEVRHACPRTTVVVNGSITQNTFVDLVCKESSFEKYAVTEETLCYKPARAFIQNSAARCSKGRLWDVKFYIKGSVSVTLFSICWDKFRQIPLFTYHKISGEFTMIDHTAEAKYIVDKQYKAPVTSWNIAKQSQTLYTLLGLRFMTHKYINPSKGQYLVKKCLTPGDDFFYATQRKVAFRTINSAPMWKTISDNSWKNVEYATRLYAKLTKRVIQVWTGTYKTLRLPFEFEGKRKQAVHLKFNPDSKRNIYLRLIPNTLSVPALFWKALFDPVDQKGIVLIVSNNPFETEKLICDDVTSLTNIPWKIGDPKNNTQGLFYSCDFIPFIFQTGLLLEEAPNQVLGKIIWPNEDDIDVPQETTLE